MQCLVICCNISILCTIVKFRIPFFFQTSLISPTAEQYDLLQHKLKERIVNGRGETMFEVGVGDGK